MSRGLEELEKLMKKLLERKAELVKALQKVEVYIQILTCDERCKFELKKERLENEMAAIDKKIIEAAKKITKEAAHEAFLLKYIQGYSLTQISEKMHYARRQVARLLAQARAEVER